MPKLLTAKRKKMNFMINEDIVSKLEQLVPAGERSDFCNNVMDEALILYGRRKAFEFFQTLPKKEKKKWTSDRIVKFIKDERKKHLL